MKRILSEKRRYKYQGYREFDLSLFDLDQLEPRPLGMFWRRAYLTGSALGAPYMCLSLSRQMLARNRRITVEVRLGIADPESPGCQLQC